MSQTTEHIADSPRSSLLQAAFRPVKVLLACYLGLAVAGFGAAVMFHGNRQLVNEAVWVRSSVVLITSAAMFLMALMAARGHRPSLLRLRIVSIIVPLVIVVIIVLPDPFPVWMKVQQGLCALVVAGAAVLVNGRDVRAEFARRAA